MPSSDLPAPILVLLGRLVQGFFGWSRAGQRFGLPSPKLRRKVAKAFYVSWQSASQQVAVVVAASIGVIPLERASADGDERLGLAHTAGRGLPDHPGDLPCFAVTPLTETESFERRRHAVTLAEILLSLHCTESWSTRAHRFLAWC